MTTRDVRIRPLWTLILLFCCLVGQLVGGVRVAWAATSADGEWEYESYGDGLQLEFYHGRDTVVKVPDHIDGLPVRMIGPDVFFSNGRIESVDIPSTVTGLSAQAFCGCVGLKEVHLLTDALTTIPMSCFMQCPSLETFEVPWGVTTIEQQAFSGCTSLREVTFVSPSTTQVIGPMAFRGCTSLTSITLPPTLKELGAEAFGGCTALKTIAFESVPDFLSNEALANCSWLETMVVPEGWSKFPQDLGGSADAVTVVYQVQDNGTAMLVHIEKGTQTSIVIPSTIASYNVTAIGDQAFMNNDVVESVSFESPCRVKSLAREAFRNCTALRSFTVPASVESVGPACFQGCFLLGSVTFDTKRLTEIPVQCFSGCSALQAIAVPEGVTRVGEQAFLGCKVLGDLVLPDSVSAIDSKAFKDCENLATVTPPDSDSKMDIADDAFDNVNPNVRFRVECGSWFEDQWLAPRVKDGTFTLFAADYMPVDLSKVSFRLVGKVSYNGTEQYPTLEAKYRHHTLAYSSVAPALSEYVFAPEGGDYTNAGTNKQIKVVANDQRKRFEGSALVTYDIDRVPMESTETKEQVGPYDWDGEPWKPDPALVTSFDGTVDEPYTLQKGVDYTVRYECNTDAGTAAVVMDAPESGGNFMGDKRIEFEIKKPDLAHATVVGITDQTYTGAAFCPRPTVSILARDKKTPVYLDLCPEEAGDADEVAAVGDYRLSYEHNTQPGTATVIVEALENASVMGSQRVDFTIFPRSLADVVVAPIDAQPYAGEELRPSPVVTADGHPLVEGTDYSLSYADNVEVGKATITIAGIGACTGTLPVTFVVRPRKVTLTSASAEKRYDATPLTANEVVVSDEGWLDGQGASYDVSGSRTIAGMSENTFSYTLDAGTDAKHYDVTCVPGTLSVTKREFYITIDSPSSKVYDGTRQISVSGNWSMPAEGDQLTSLELGSAQEKVGTWDIVASDFQIENAAGESVVDSYELIYNGNQATITPCPITIDPWPRSFVYDRTAHTPDSCVITNQWTYQQGLCAGDQVKELSVEGSQTEIGSSDSRVSSATIVNAGGEDVTSCYDIEYRSMPIEVIKRWVSLESASASKPYDGTPLTADGIEVGGDGWLEGDGASYRVTGKQTEVGSSENGFSYTLNAGTDTSHYWIDCSYGTLTVTPASSGMVTGKPPRGTGSATTTASTPERGMTTSSGTVVRKGAVLPQTGDNLIPPAVPMLLAGVGVVLVAVAVLVRRRRCWHLGR